MANRHLARSVAMQSLFEWDFKGTPTAILPAIIDHNLAEFAPGLEEKEFSKKLVDGVIENLKEIDQLIGSYAPSWPINQITIVDRNILRVSVFRAQVMNVIGCHQRNAGFFVEFNNFFIQNCLFRNIFVFLQF